MTSQRSRSYISIQPVDLFQDSGKVSPLYIGWRVDEHGAFVEKEIDDEIFEYTS